MAIFGQIPLTIPNLFEILYLLLQEKGPLVVGVILCTLSRKNEKKEKAEPDDFELPEKFHKLEKFFDDLKTDYGRRCIFEELAIETMLDIFIIATR